MERFSLIRKLMTYGLGLSLIVFGQSCTLILSHQNARLKGGDPEIEYYINSRQVFNGKNEKIAKRKPFVLSRQRDGYFTDSEVRIGKRLDPVILLSIYAWPFLPIDLFAPGGPSKHKPTVDAPTKALVPLPETGTPGVYIATSPTLDSVKIESVREIKLRKYQSYDPQRIRPFSAETKKLYASEKSDKIYYLTETADELLETMKCKPDITTLLIPYEKYVSLGCRITAATMVSVKHGNMERGHYQILFYINDHFDNRLDSIEINANSIWVSKDKYTNELISTAMEDALSKLVTGKEFEEKVKLIKQNSDKIKSNNAQLSLKKSTSTPSLENATQSQITLVDEDFIASGVVISPDGYIVTSYLNVQNRDSLMVVLPGGSKLKPELLRVDARSNLALLKVDTVGLASISPLKNGAPKLGSVVYAIGTPVNLSLSQSLTKGIVSSTRVENDIPYLQTDTRTSFGNNGSPVVDASGNMVGILNEKLYFTSAQGLSLVVPIDTVLDRLGITFN